MKRSRILATLILLLLFLPAFAATPLDAVIRALHVSGYASPAAAVARLQEVGPPDADAPLAERQRYYAAIGRYASMDNQIPLSAPMADALAKLQLMASTEGCDSCQVDIRMIKAQSALARRNIMPACPTAAL